MVHQPDAIARWPPRRVHVIRGIQPRVGATEHHLSEVVETVVDVMPRSGRSRLVLVRRRGRGWGRDNSLANPIETMKGMKHGHNVGPYVRVWTEEHEAVIPLWDERGPFEVGEGTVDGVVHRFLGEETDGA